MSRMSDMNLTIQQYIDDGYSLNEIAEMLNISLEWVIEVADQMESLDDYYDDSMDGDHASALASVGWGTDEDYGYYGEDF